MGRERREEAEGRKEDKEGGWRRKEDIGGRSKEYKDRKSEKV